MCLVQIRPDAPWPGADEADRAVRDWATLYDHVYSNDVGAGGRYELAGWRSRVDGMPFAESVMDDWLGMTLRRLRALRPRHVLEIGCGTGMLVQALHGEVESYTACDVSAVAVDRLRDRVPEDVVLLRAQATDVVRVAAQARGAVDCVVLNSVTQHFPSEEYLAEVLHGALEVLDGAGTVFVGDVRHAGLAQHAARWVCLRRRPAAGPDELEDLARAMVEHEQELLLDPHRLAQCVRVPGVRMRAHVRPLRHDTELARYRYDAVLSAAPEASTPAAATVPWAGLGDPGGRTGRCVDVLRSGTPTVVTGIPHPWLRERHGDGGPPDPATLLGLVGREDAEVEVDPEDPLTYRARVPFDGGARPVAEWTTRSARHRPGRALPEPLRRRVARQLWDFLSEHDVPTGSVRLVVERADE